MRILVYMIALLFTVLVTPKVSFLNRSLLAWFLMAIGLGLITALVKPTIQFLTLRFIFATGGLVLVVINTVLLYLLQWLLPNHFTVTNLFWAAVGGVAFGLSSAFLENLLGLTPPIVSEKYPEIRQRVKDRRFYQMQNELSRIDAVKTGSAKQLAAVKTMVVESNPAVTEIFSRDSALHGGSAPDDLSLWNEILEPVRRPGEVSEPTREEISGTAAGALNEGEDQPPTPAPNIPLAEPGADQAEVSSSQTIQEA